MVEQYVNSGSYIVDNMKDVLLKACLGTCVGVTLCDNEARVGGLLHILLPEPTGSDMNYPAETYASTGMPNFIDAMCKKGASKENMTACIAGGALVGPVSEMDLSLDIGGRSTEIVLSVLKQEGIPVSRMEAGGFFACKLTLSLNTFETVIEPLVDGDMPVDIEAVKPSFREIKMAIQTVRPIPQIVLKILRMIRKDDYDIEEVGREVSKDQIITAKVLQLCNSPVMGLKVMVDSINRAIVILGEKKLMQLILSASVEAMFPDVMYGYSLCRGGLYQHSLGTAFAAMELASLTGVVTPDLAYTAGLLHDIGKIPLDQYVSLVVPYFYRSVNDGKREVLDVEKETFGISHVEAGGILGRKWSLPVDLIDAIEYHHYPEDTDRNRELVTLVYFADLIMSRFQVGYELESLNTDMFTQRLDVLGLKPNQFYDMISRIPPSVFSMADNL